jgi:deoxyribonuclease-4
MRKIGAHVSAAGGFDKAVERAAELGANCAQIFSGSPRVWARSPLASIDTEKMFAKKAERSILSIITHSLYLINLASDKPDSVRKSAEALKYDLRFDSLIKGSGIVVHLGSHQGRGWESVKQAVADEIKAILDDTPADSTFLIENSAGQNGKLCTDLSQIRWLLDEVNSSRLGWCLDTCHAHAAGYALGDHQLEQAQDIVHKNGYHIQSLVEAITEFKLWADLKVIHVNDSKDPFASGRDRQSS